MKFKLKFLKRIFNPEEKRIIFENKQSKPFSAELPFTKEDIYKEFGAVLKENPGKMNKECLRRIKCVEVVDMHINTGEWIEMNYRLKFNNDIYEHNVGTSGLMTPRSWAEYFYGEILQNYNPQENDPEIKALIRKAGKQARRRLFFKLLLWRGLGSCHMVWDLQKEILKDKYEIDWKMPTERNSNICYD
jgi:hypothetical protein